MGTDFETLRNRRKPREKTVAVPLDEDLLQRIDEIERRLPREKARDQHENRTPVAPRLEAELKQLEDEAADAAEEFTFRELPRPEFRDLVSQHPDPAGKLRWNEDTFAPALLAACCTSHEFDEAQWKMLWDEWAGWVMMPLAATALEVCEEPSRVPFGRRNSGGTDSLPPNSEPAEPTE